MKRKILYNNFRGEILHNDFRGEILHNNFRGDILHNNFRGDILHNDFYCATGEETQTPTPEKKTPSNAFMVIVGVAIIGFLAYQSFIK